MKKKAILTLLVLGVTSLSLTGCNKQTDLEKAIDNAYDFLDNIDYINVNWEAFQYTYDWANLEDGRGQAMERVISLTEKDFYPYGSQSETWWNIANLEPIGSESTETFYYVNGYGFEPETHEAWTYADTYDDAVDYYLEDIDLQIIWEMTEGEEFTTQVDLEYTDDVITGAIFYHYSETEGVGYVNDSFTYRTDKTGRLTQYIYETLTHVEQEYQGQLMTLDIYAKHDLGEIDGSTIYVPDFNLDDYNIEGVEPGYDIEVPTIPGHGEVIKTETLDKTAAQTYISETDLDAIYDWTGYAYDWPSLSEGGYEQIEYIAEKDGHPYGIVEEYLGNPGGDGTLVEGLYYDGTGYQYEYGPASSGEGADVGSAVSTTDTYRSLLEEKLYHLGDDGFFGQLNSALTGINKDYFELTASRITYDDGTIAVDIKYRADYAAANPDYGMTEDYQEYQCIYYFDSNLSLIGINVRSEGYAEYEGSVMSHEGYNHILYEIDEGNVTAVLPDWVSEYFE